MKNYVFSPFAPLLIRIAVGFYFFLLGLWGYLEQDLFYLAVERYAGFTSWYANLYTSPLCYIFFITGILLILGWYARLAAIVGAITVLPLLYGAGAFTPADGHLVYFLEKRSLYRDMVIFAGCLSLFLSGPGALSLDGIFRAVYGKDAMR